MSETRSQRIVKALDELAVFLEEESYDFWADKLKGLRQEFMCPETLDSARMELNRSFGGMGSLNDLFFEDEQRQARFDRLADIVFRENRLYSASWPQRLAWRIREFSQKDELPPRIKNGFTP